MEDILPSLNSSSVCQSHFPTVRNWLFINY